MMIHAKTKAKGLFYACHMKTSPSIIPVQLENGSIIRIQATPIGETAGTPPPAIGEEIESDVSLNLQPLKDVADSIEGIAQTIKTALDKIKPTKASVEFGVEFGVESGQLTAMIVQGNGSANLKICMEWNESKSDDG